MKRLLTGLLAAMALVASACGGTATPSSSSSGSNYYAGKTITLLVPNAPGGPMDAAARLTAPYLQKYTGADSVNVQTVQGAGGVIGLNKFAQAAPDGLTIGFTSVPTVMTTTMVGGSSVKYDGTQFVYLGRLSTEARVLVAAKKSSIKSLSDLKSRSSAVKIPIQGFDDDFYTMAALAGTLGFTPRYITGFGSAGEATQSIVVGNTDVMIGSLESLVPTIQSGDAVPILMIAAAREKSYPNVPTWSETVDSSKKSIATAFLDLIELERSYFAPPGTAADAVTAFRNAVDKMTHDSSFIAKAKQQQLPVVYLSGADEQKQIGTVKANLTGILPLMQSAKSDVQK